MTVVLKSEDWLGVKLSKAGRRREEHSWQMEQHRQSPADNGSWGVAERMVGRVRQDTPRALCASLRSVISVWGGRGNIKEFLAGGHQDHIL